ncbi:MAG: TetR/AcrR family transcriptional regulator [Treponema sp.]|nr:TetR/AcrR family transcriptional regulator [Treponema sp.]
MSKPETDLALRIRDKTLELLLEKEPGEISTRDIAKACKVTATSLYYYYRDKEALFTEVKLACIEKMNAAITEQISKKKLKQLKAGKKPNPLEEAKTGLEAFRDWAFNNPRIALLVMGQLKADTWDDPKMEKYCQSTVNAKTAFDQAVRTGLSASKNTLLDASLCVAAIWGAIEFVLHNRIIPQYRTQRGSIDFTNKMIDLVLTSLLDKPAAGGLYNQLPLARRPEARIHKPAAGGVHNQLPMLSTRSARRRAAPR